MAGRRIVLVPGNHDHRLAEPLLEEVALGGTGLGLEHRALPAGEAGRPDRRLARRGRAQHRLPRRLAARRRLRDPRPLHGLPHVTAAPGVRRRGGDDALRRPPGPACGARRLRARPAPDLRLLLRLRRGRPGAASAIRPSERAWRSISGRDGNGNRLRQATAKAAISRRNPGQRLAAQPARPGRLRGRRLRRLDHPRAASPPRPRCATACRIEAAHVITGHTHRAGPEESDAEWPLADGGTPPQHRQLGLRRRPPPPRRSARALLAGNGHLGRGRGRAAPGAPA